MPVERRERTDVISLWQIAVYSLGYSNRNYNTGKGLFWAITFLLLMLEIWTVYHFVSYDLQINLAHELLVYHVCGKLDSSYKFSIDICCSGH